MKLVLAFVTGTLGAEVVLPHLSPDWKIVAGSAFGGFVAYLVSRRHEAFDAEKLADRAAQRALELHEARYHTRHDGHAAEVLSHGE